MANRQLILRTDTASTVFFTHNVRGYNHVTLASAAMTNPYIRISTGNNVLSLYVFTYNKTHLSDDVVSPQTYGVGHWLSELNVPVEAKNDGTTHVISTSGDNSGANPKQVRNHYRRLYICIPPRDYSVNGLVQVMNDLLKKNIDTSGEYPELLNNHIIYDQDEDTSGAIFFEYVQNKIILRNKSYGFSVLVPSSSMITEDLRVFNFAHGSVWPTLGYDIDIHCYDVPGYYQYHENKSAYDPLAKNMGGTYSTTTSFFTKNYGLNGGIVQPTAAVGNVIDFPTSTSESIVDGTFQRFEVEWYDSPVTRGCTTLLAAQGGFDFSKPGVDNAYTLTSNTTPTPLDLTNSEYSEFNLVVGSLIKITTPAGDEYTLEISGVSNLSSGVINLIHQVDINIGVSLTQNCTAHMDLYEFRLARLYASNQATSLEPVRFVGMPSERPPTHGNEAGEGGLLQTQVDYYSTISASKNLTGSSHGSHVINICVEECTSNTVGAYNSTQNYSNSMTGGTGVIGQVITHEAPGEQISVVVPADGIISTSNKTAYTLTIRDEEGHLIEPRGHCVFLLSFTKDNI